MFFKLKSLFFFICFFPLIAKPLNVFELSLIGVGSSIIYHQYFDKSLDVQSKTVKKSKIMNDYFESRKNTISTREFYSLPLQEQLMVLEVINSYNN